MRIWAFLTGAAVLAIALAWGLGHAGSISLRSVDNGELPSFDSADLSQLSPDLSPISTALALQFERVGVHRRVWPLSVSRTMRATATSRDGGGGPAGGLGFTITTPSTPRGAAPSPAEQERANGDQIHLLEAWPHGNVRIRRAVLGERVFQILVAGPGLARMPNFDAALTGEPLGEEYAAGRAVVVAIEEGEDGRVTSFVTEGEPRYVMDNVRTGAGAPVETQYTGPWSFAAVPMQDALAVIYRDRGGIFARRLEIRDSDLAFGEPWRIADAPDNIHHYQIVAHADQTGAIHVLWSLQPASEVQGGRANLSYCRIDAVRRTGCGDPHVLSQTTEWQPINLMIQGERVYAAWVDTRHTRGIWDRRNFSKLYFAVSTDRGASFREPVSINRPRDNSDNVHAAVTVPVDDGGILVFWASRRADPGRLEDQDYRAGRLDRELKWFEVGADTISGQMLYERIAQVFLRSR